MDYNTSGRAPDKELWLRTTNCSLVRFENKFSGNDHDKGFNPRSSSTKADSSPSSAGIGADRLLLERFYFWRLVRLPITEGIEPDK
ncbi:hypothetical protein FRX31_032515 [Thalictrum thalictroides]|uniref:Uncharacterized protein n=1 Tax=Thalictrum thalictroides TaxID=46969 RepID=A0A7J6UZ39_THATH|nr:hypothetical protein FRX31_032515 [Thalictrum thalictroides]